MTKGIAVAVAAFHLAIGVPAAPQVVGPGDPMETSVQRAYDAVRSSVVRLRTEASVELTLTDSRSGLRSVVKRPLSVNGTGVVVGEVVVDGRREYLVLTNHHVADPSNYVVQEGRFLKENRNNTRAIPEFPEETFLTFSADGAAGEGDIRLIELSRVVHGDMTLMRTVGADRPLTVFEGSIGFDPGTVHEGMPILTTGFPNGGDRIDDAGTIVEIDRVHELGTPHEDFVLSVPVEHGQSGSPVFTVEDFGGGVEFRLIGLLHAREEGTSYMVPATLWEHALAVDGIPARRRMHHGLLADAH